MYCERLEDRLAPAAAVWTNVSDYAPLDTAYITGIEFTAGETVQLQVVKTADGSVQGSWQVAADADGNFQTQWTVCDCAGAKLQLTATGVTSGLTAQDTFLDSTLRLFEDSTRLIQRDAFAWGSTVYARATSLTDSRCYRVDYTSPSGTTSNFLPAGTSSRNDSFTIPATGPSGVWTARLFRGPSGGACSGTFTPDTDDDATKIFDVARVVIVGAGSASKATADAVGGDNFVRQDTATTVQGSPSGRGDELQVASRFSGGLDRNRRTFLRFDIAGAGIPGTASVTNAKVRLFMFDDPGSSRTHNLHRVTASWGEGTVHWNNQPAVAGSATSFLATGTNDDVFLRWSANADVQSFVSGSATNHGWRISDAAENSPPEMRGIYRSTEAGSPTDRRELPVLLIDYVDDATPPTVVSINRASANPTNAASVNWTVTFSESVTGVNAGDFALAASGVSGASITNVSGSGATYTVTASTGTGDGTLGLNLVDDDSIQDAAGNKLGGTGASNGNFTGQVYTIDKTKPVITGSRSPAANAHGWNNGNVVVSFSCTDSGGSGKATDTVAGATVMTEGAGQSVTNTGTCTDNAGNVADSATVSGINIDKTTPTISGSRTPGPNVNGWNNTDVTVSYSCTDGLSGVDTFTGPQVVSTEGAGQSRSGTCTDKAGNSAGATVSGINIDKTAPTISAAVLSGTLGNNGWYITNVVVRFTCSDGLSGVASCPADVTLTAEGAAVTASGTAIDNADNSAGASLTVKIDKTPPTISAAVFSGTLGANGWYTSNVVVRFTCADATSGVASCPADVTLTTEGAAVTASGTAADNAGWTASASLTVKIDMTPPVITPTITGTLGGGGWYVSDVTVSWSVTDTISGVASSTGCGTTTLGETAGTTLTCSATNNAGLSNSVTTPLIKIDKTTPVTANVALSPSSVAVGSTTAVTISGTATDNLSGVASATFNVFNGSNAVVATGSLTVTTAGNTSVTLSGSFTAAGLSLVTGVYNVCVASTDVAGHAEAFDTTDVNKCALLAVYDASAGFVTGGGWFITPLESMPSNPTATGKSNFGFVSKYHQGQQTPSGHTEFQFKAGNVNFKSGTYEWLVIAGSRAQYRGVGTVNGSGDYGFMLTGIDGQIPGGGGTDKIRIKIWNRSGNCNGNGCGLFYDNKTGSSDAGNDSTELGGGSIVIHSNPLRALAGQGSRESLDALTAAQLQPVVTEALNRWVAAGLSRPMQEVLRQTDVRIAELPAGNLGLSSLGFNAPSTIWISPTAAGHGWDQMDLLSVVVHEMGNVIGLQDTNQLHRAMGTFLEVGVRRLPIAADLSDPRLLEVAATAALSAPVAEGGVALRLLDTTGNAAPAVADTVSSPLSSPAVTPSAGDLFVGPVTAAVRDVHEIGSAQRQLLDHVFADVLDAVLVDDLGLGFGR